MPSNDNHRDWAWWVEKTYPLVTVVCIFLAAATWGYAVITFVERMKQ